MNIRLFLLFYLVLGAAFNTQAFCDEDENLASAGIPAALLKNANAVFRNYHMAIRISSADEAYVTKRYSVTILNEKGDKYASVYEYYDMLSSVQGIHGWLYDKDGKEIDKIKKNMVRDMSAFDMNFVDDIRAKTFSFHHSIYPYTCVFEIETKLSFLVFMPTWEPQENYDCSVETADLEVTYPKDFPLRYKTFHITSTPVIETEHDDSKLKINVTAIPANEKPDYFCPIETFYRPTLILAADKFELGENKGSMASWQDFGRFFYQLNTGKDDLPEETKKMVHQLTDTCHSAAGKIAFLYEYLKKNTRYVSIQLGIGSWQTLDAGFVAEKGYGDCKALTNFMKALLKEAGITAYQALAYGGAREYKSMQLDFTYNAFNHVILCVPQQKDSVWLECTSKDLPAGYLSSFTGNRYVLLLTPDGGVPVKTPGFNRQNSLVARRANILINDKDELTGSIDSRYQGLGWESEKWIENQPKSKIDNYLNRKFAIPTYSVTDYKVHTSSAEVPTISEHVTVSGSGSTTRSGKRVFVSAHMLRLTVEAPPSYEKRKEPFQILAGLSMADTTIINLQGKYALESLPQEVNMDFPFATYHSKISFESGNVVKVISSFDQRDGIYPAELFSDYISLCNEINNNAVNERMILSRKD